MKRLSNGFTLIELLIVIALLGALAVALLAALDPLEQIKKGTDTGVRNTAAEISSSLTRYAAVKGGSFPVPTGSLDIDHGLVNALAQGATPLPTNVPQVAIQAAVDAGELKSDFFTLAGNQLDKIAMAYKYDSTTQKFYVCFTPSSKSFRSDSNTKFIKSATTPGTMDETTCYANGTDSAAAGGHTCYWCSQ